MLSFGPRQHLSSRAGCAARQSADGRALAPSSDGSQHCAEQRRTSDEGAGTFVSAQSIARVYARNIGAVEDVTLAVDAHRAQVDGDFSVADIVRDQVRQRAARDGHAAVRVEYILVDRSQKVLPRVRLPDIDGIDGSHQDFGAGCKSGGAAPARFRFEVGIHKAAFGQRGRGRIRVVTGVGRRRQRAGKHQALNLRDVDFVLAALLVDKLDGVGVPTDVSPLQLSAGSKRENLLCESQGTGHQKNKRGAIDFGHGEFLSPL